jgi:hypothetical protein
VTVPPVVTPLPPAVITPPPVVVTPPPVEAVPEDAGPDELSPITKNPVKPTVVKLAVVKPNEREAECVVDARWKKSIESDLRELSKVVAAKMDTTLFGTYTRDEDAVVEKAERARTNADCVAVEGRVDALMKKYGNQ